MDLAARAYACGSGHTRGTRHMCLCAWIWLCAWNWARPDLATVIASTDLAMRTHAHGTRHVRLHADLVMRSYMRRTGHAPVHADLAARALVDLAACT